MFIICMSVLTNFLLKVILALGDDTLKEEGLPSDPRGSLIFYHYSTINHTSGITDNH